MRKQQDNSEEENFRIIDNQVTSTDLYHKMYLKPLQLKLDQKKGGLPTGLKIVQRKNETQYDIVQIGKQKLLTFGEFHQFKKINSPELRQFSNYFEYAKENQADNLLCQMKAHGTPLEMGCCICMYNEDRKMLQYTLRGVAQNIYRLWKQGQDTDKMFVAIVQDGIQKMNESILSLFQILQNQSGIRFSQDTDQKFEQRMSQISKIQNRRNNQEIQEEDGVTDINAFLFTPSELQQRKKMRFINVKKQYQQIKKIQKQVNILKKKKNIISFDLTGIILQFYQRLCYEDHTGQPYPNSKLDQNAKNIVKQYYYEEHKKSQPFIRDALTKAERYCNQYISSRMDMAHVSFFRTSYYFPTDYESSQRGLDQQDHPLLTQNQRRRQSKYRNISKQAVKMNIFFVVKYQNAQKLSSHNWFFNGFCKQFCDFSKQNGTMKCISPKYTILLDVGLKPQDGALVKMYNVMQNHPQIGGVCGYMNLKLQKPEQNQSPSRFNLDAISNFCLNFVDIQRAQQLQYHFAHLIDKGFQSIFKFIHVLPGAFSGYNMQAIWGKIEDNNNNNVDSLLLDYFSSISQKLSGQNYQSIQLSFCQVIGRIVLPNKLIKCFFKRQNKNNAQQLMYSSNVNLAEDRILCMGIRKNKKRLMFIPDANSYVDPVKDIPNLLGQRKRWINGSYFAFDKVSDQFQQTEGCCHILGIQINYLAFMNLLAYIAPGFYLFSVSVAMQAFKADVLTKFFQDTLTETSQIYGAFVYTINFFYALMIGGLIFFSVNITNKEPKFIRFVYALSTFLGIMSMIMMTILMVDLIRGLGTRQSSYLISNSSFTQNIPGGQSTIDILRYVVLAIMGLYALPIIMYSCFFKTFSVIVQILSGTISFMFYQPTYLIILSTYALCRMDDLSWGTKGLQSGASSQNKQITSTWSKIKTIHVGKYLFWNVIVAAILIHFGSNYLVRFWLTFALMILIGGTMLIKVILALTYYVYYKCFITNTPKHPKTNPIVPCLYKCFDEDDPEFGRENLGTVLRSIIRNNVQTLRNACRQNSGQNSNSILAMQFLASMMNKSKNSQINKSNKEGFGKVLSGINKMSKNLENNNNKFKKKISLAPNNNSPTINNKLNMIKEVNQQQIFENTAAQFISNDSPQKKHLNLPQVLPPIKEEKTKRPKQDFIKIRKNLI